MTGWTDERCDTLRKLWAEGLSCSQIAGELGGMTRNAVIGKVGRLGLTRRRMGVNPIAAAARALKPRSVIRNPLGLNGRKSRLKPPIEFDAATDLPPDTPANPVTLLDLQEHHCRWPFGDPQTRDFVFCGADKVDGHSYCARHCRLSYQPMRRPKHRPWRELGRFR